MKNHANQKKKLKKQKKAVAFVLVIGVVIPLYYILYAILNDQPVPENSTWWIETIVTFCLTVVLSTSLYITSTAIARKLEKILPWREEARKRFITEFLLVSISTIIISGFIGFLFYYVYTDCKDPIPLIFDIIIKSLVINTIATAIYEGVFFLNQWKAALVNAEKLKQENLQSQFDSLKNQVNPHFLFNSLNTLATIIPEDPEQAVKFVQKLSSVYRYLLQYKDNETVDLQTELDCINAYFFLQKIRFGENLHVNIDIPVHQQNRQIPPLSLQILVENAIKHNIISQHKPLTVHIYIDDAGMLVTRNTLQKKKSVESSTKIGLQNLMNRFTYIFGQGIDIFETDTDFIVKVPLG
jgi:two-component system, LytTR family, sensor kinase